MVEQATDRITQAKSRPMHLVGGRRAIGYSRKSRVTSRDYISDEIQKDGILRAADRRGDAVTEIFGDWDKSGAAGKEHLRSDYQKVLRLIENNEVSVLYGYDRSRLSRSLVETARLAELCNKHGTLIVTDKEGELDYLSASGKMVVNLLATIAQNVIDQSADRARDGIAVRRARGDIIGAVNYGWMIDPADRTKLVRNPDEPLERIIELYTETRSYMKTAKRLTLEGVPTRRMNLSEVWTTTVVQRIVTREAPHLVPVRRHWGVKPSAPFIFYRMLVCHCGRVLTGERQPDRYGRLRVRYICQNGRKDPRHTGRQSVHESMVLPWLKDAVATWTDNFVLFDVVAQANETAAERTMLEGRRRRVLDLYKAGDIEADEKDADLTAIKDRLAELETTDRAAVPPRIDWDVDEPATINETVRALMAPVQLDAQLRPTEPVFLLGRVAPAQDA